MIALVVLADIIVFADLARYELSGLQARYARRRSATDALGDHRAPGSEERSPS